jgi:uncharacterized protein involved in exopolysaccharide biosynthesis/Mrp family chromosome partitioning ATPase
MNRIFSIAARHWKPVVAVNALIFSIAAFNILNSEKSWNAYAQLILPSTTTDLNADLGTLGQLRGGQGLIVSQQIDSRQTLSSIMTSDEVVRLVWESDPEREEFGRLGAYKGLFEVTPSATTTVISIASKGHTPELAQDRLERLIQSFQNRLNSLRQSDAEQRLAFVEEELLKAEISLSQSENNLANFQEATSLVDVDTQARTLTESINTLNLARGNLMAQYVASQTRVQSLSSQLGQNPMQAIQALQLAEDPMYQAVLTGLSEIETSLVTAQSQFTDEHPAVQGLLFQQNELFQRQNELVGEAATRVAGVDTTIGVNRANLIRELILEESATQALEQQAIETGQQLEELVGQLREIPASRSRLGELQRQFDIAEGVYTGIIAQIQATRVNAFSTYPSVQILDTPSADPRPESSLKLIALGAIVASLFSTAALILFLESRNPLLSRKDLEQVDFEILGAIPHLHGFSNSVDHRLENSIALQRLATAITMLATPKNRLIIGSPTSNEGKTVITLGLGLVLSDLGFKVLMVDADFQENGLGRRLGLAESLGYDGAKPVGVRNKLDVIQIPIVREGVSEFISSGKLERYLDQLQESGEYDYVLIDSTSFDIANDLTLMTRVVSHVLLVVRPGTSYRDSFYETIEYLSRHGGKVAGITLNDVQGQPAAREREESVIPVKSLQKYTNSTERNRFQK